MKLLLVLALCAPSLHAQTTGRHYYATPLDSIPLTTRAYVRVVAKIDSSKRIGSTLRLFVRAGDSRLVADCVRGFTFRLCPNVRDSSVVALYGRRFKSPTLGWILRPIEGIETASPMVTTCLSGGVRQVCWLKILTDAITP